MMKYDKLIDVSLIVVALAGFGFGTVNIAQTMNANAKADAFNAKVDKQDRQTNQKNKALTNTLFSKQVSDYLTQAYVGNLSNAKQMWDYAHNSNVFIGFDSLQGKDKDFFLSSYDNGVSSNVSDIKSAYSDNKFVVTFTYSVQHKGTNASLITSEKVYVMQGHLDNGRYVVDNTTSATIN